MPRIIDDDLFYRVQEIIDRNKSVPARTREEKWISFDYETILLSLQGNDGGLRRYE